MSAPTIAMYLFTWFVQVRWHDWRQCGGRTVRRAQDAGNHWQRAFLQPPSSQVLPPPSLLHQVSLFTLPHYHTHIFLPPIIPCAVKQLSNHFLKSGHYRSSPLTVTQNHYQIFNATQATNKQTNNARKPQEKLIIPPKTSRLWAPLTSQGKVT